METRRQIRGINKNTIFIPFLSLALLLGGAKIGSDVSRNRQKIHNNPQAVVATLNYLGEIDPETSENLQNLYEEFKLAYQQAYDDGPLNSDRLDNVDRSLYNIYVEILCEELCKSLNLKKENFEVLQIVRDNDSTYDKFYVEYKSMNEEELHRLEIQSDIAFYIRNLENRRFRDTSEVRKAKDFSIDLLLNNLSVDDGYVRTKNDPKLRKIVLEIINYMQEKEEKKGKIIS